jgi:hypothetical protein
MNTLLKILGIGGVLYLGFKFIGSGSKKDQLISQIMQANPGYDKAKLQAMDEATLQTIINGGFR